jgi:CRISPR/Cas system Type II protein with McrA/HNH and RuvC-like nuclease domain
MRRLPERGWGWFAGVGSIRRMTKTEAGENKRLRSSEGRTQKRQATLVALISSNRLCSFKRLIKHVSQVGFIAIIRNSVKRFKSMPLKYYKLREREA